jgi:malate synthase
VSTFAGVAGLAVTGPIGDRFDEVLTPRALELAAHLHRELDGRRLELLPAHQERLQALAEGGSAGSSAGTAHVREDDPRQLFLEMAVSDEYRGSLPLPAGERMPRLTHRPIERMP